jgi:protein TonB
MPEHRRTFLYSFLFTLLLLAGLPIAARAQDAAGDWKTLSPEGEEFAILMPKGAKFEESTEPYHRDMTLNTRLYLSAPPRGPVVAVVSLSGIKAGGVAEYLRLNSYVDAFKNWFPQKVRSKDAAVKLTLVGEKTLNGNLGREYRLVIGDLSGTTRVFATRRRFYAAVILSTKKEDELTEQFFSSFILPEKTTQPQAVAGGGSAVGAEFSANRNPATPKENTEEAQKSEPLTITADAKPDDTANASSKPRAPISGGILNGKATTLVKPDYPAEARSAGVGGTVMVQVLIDEAGNVMNATAVSGDPLLRQACVIAALGSRFSPTKLNGEAVKVSGVLQYNFVAR